MVAVKRRIGMGMQETITDRLVTGLSGLRHLEVVNESSRHNVPPGAESHFKLVLVADEFAGMNLLARHRRVHGILTAELAEIHALSVHAYTADEWSARMGDAPMSPPCMGGSRADRAGAN
jgi:BolA protein